MSVLNYNKKELDEIKISPEHFIELIDMIDKGEITELKAKEILRSWKEKSFSPKEEAKNFSSISNTDELGKVAKEIMKENKKAVEDFKNGKKESLNFLIGKIMQKTNKRADFKTAKEVLERLI